MSAHTPTIHAGCIIFGRAGVLIRGPSGAGKSRLILELIRDEQARGGYARLVADDRVHLAAHHGRLVAFAPEALKGRIEARGYDVVTLPHAGSTVIRLVVDLVPEVKMPRLQEENSGFIKLFDIDMPILHTSVEAARRLIPVVLATNSYTH